MPAVHWFLAWRRADRVPVWASASVYSPIGRGGIVLLLAASILVVAMLMYGAGLSIAPLAPATLTYAFVFTLLGAVCWACRGGGTPATRMARDLAEYFGLFAAIALVGAIASYPVAAYSHGFVDPLLQRVDLALGFRWLDWYRTVAAHPWLRAASRTAYAMIYVSPAILLGHLAITGQRREAHEFMVAVWLAAVITLIAFRFMPAVGPFAYLWHGRIPYLPVSDLWQPQLIPQLRDHAMSQVDLGHLVGLVSAPSFHAASGVLLIAFAWRQPRIRPPLIAINVAMLLSTPVEGTHYLTDMILGAAVALVALGVTAQFRAGPVRGGSAALRAPAFDRAGDDRVLVADVAP